MDSHYDSKPNYRNDSFKQNPRNDQRQGHSQRYNQVTNFKNSNPFEFFILFLFYSFILFIL